MSDLSSSSPPPGVDRVSAAPVDPAAWFPSLRPVGAGASAYLVTLGLGFAAWHRAQGAGAAVMLGCFVPSLLAGALASSSQDDRNQYVARLLAAALMAPLLLFFASLDGPFGWGTGLALALGFVLLHVAALLGGVWLLASAATRIDARPAPVDSARLLQRLSEIARLHHPIALQRGASERLLRFDWQPPAEPGRRHVVTLRLDAARRRMMVTERLQADGAAPLDAAEASMRSAGEPAFDPARPSAQRVWLQTVQATLLEPAQLAAAPVSAAGDVLPAAALTDGRALLATMAAIVTRSGWHWRPALFDRG